MNIEFIDRIKEYILQKSSDFGLDKEVVEARCINNNYYNTDFVVRTSDENRFVVRCNFDTQIMMKEQVKYEFGILKILENSSVTPKPIRVISNTQNSLKWGFMVREFIPGIMVTKNEASYLEDIAKSFATVHKIELDQQQIDEVIVERNLFSDKIKDSQRLMYNVWTDMNFPAMFKRKFAMLMNYCMKLEMKQSEFKKPDIYCLNNLSMESENFVLSDQYSNIYMADWSRAVYSHPVQDISLFLSDLRAIWMDKKILSPEEKEEFIQYYCNFTGYDIMQVKEKLELFEPYVKLRTLAWFSNMYENHISGKTSYKDEDIFEKLKYFIETDNIDEYINKYI